MPPSPPPPDRSPDVPTALRRLRGTVLEQRYELGRVLGSGGMGAVFEARHLRLDRLVAIKVLWPALAKEGVYVERFLREAKVTSKIRHRNVVEILDYGEAADGLVYSVMELLVGQDLHELLETQLQGRLPWVQACELLVQIASGLKAAHARGVIHRDIKPANCFLTDEDDEPVVKLVDFGVAKLEDDQGQPLTGVAQVLGTPSYIAPEMVREGVTANPRTDVYALGVLAYRMLTGRVPFKAKTLFELVRQACFEPVPSLRDQVPAIPPAVEAFVMGLLAKDPEQRPADMATVRGQLVALSRETFGPHAVELDGSSRLVVHAVESGPPPIAMEDPILTWSSVEPPQPLAPRPRPGSTEVVDLPLEGVEILEDTIDGASTLVVDIPSGAIKAPRTVPSVASTSLPPPPPPSTAEQRRRWKSRRCGS